MGIALGVMHLSYDDFCRMTLEEFGAVYDAYLTQRDFDYKDRWERMRLQSLIYVQMHLSKGKTITATELLPLPWDKTPEKHKDTRTAAEQRARTEELMQRAALTNENKE